MMTPFDLHVLSTPPAFILSQDQTLEKILLRSTPQNCELLLLQNSRVVKPGHGIIPARQKLPCRDQTFVFLPFI